MLLASNWFQSYLTKRTLYVQYSDTSSSIREIETGAPQGSILGPLSLSYTIMINMKLSKIADWLTQNKLSLNTAKSKFMLFHNYKKTMNEDDIHHLAINDTIIERVTEFNSLGLTINEFMNSNAHASKITDKISRTLGVMNRLKRYLPLSAMKRMYCCLILSHLQFAITSRGFEWERLSKLQKRAIRIMTNSKYNAHTNPLFKSSTLLTIKDIFDVQCMKIWYKFVNIMWCQHILLPFLYTTVNWTTFKPEATNFCIYIRFLLPMPAMPWDIEFPNYYVNIQLLSKKKPILTA